MSVDWRRKDSAYAAATAVAAAFVVYIVAGNLGLVPSPFGVFKPLNTPASIAAPTLDSQPTAARTTASTLLGSSGSPGPSSTPGGADLDRPSGSINQPEPVDLTLTEAATVTGKAGDDSSGIDKVVVTFVDSAGASKDVPADLNCNATRTRCAWTANVPDVAGSYRVTGNITDRAGNTSRTPQTDVTVVNVGGPLEDLRDGLGSVLDGVVELLS